MTLLHISSPRSLWLPFLLLGLLCLSSPSSTIAEEAPPPDWRSLLVDDQTIAILELNLQSIEPSEVLRWLAAEGGVEVPKEASFMAAMADGMAETLRSAGAQSVFATASARNLLTEGVIAIPCEQTAPVVNLLQMATAQLPPEAGYRIHHAPGVVVLSSERFWQRLQERMERSETAEVPRLSPVGPDDDLPHAVTFSLPERLRDELIALWPDRMPRGVPLQVSPQQLATDLQSLTLRLRLPPEPRIEMRLKAEEKAAAERLADSVRQAIRLLPVSEDQQGTVEVQEAIVTARWDAAMFQALLQEVPVDATRRTAGSNQLKQIALAIHHYHDVHGHLPPRMTVDGEGRPLLSWRVHLLPYLGQQELYNRFRLNEPWDSPHNRPLSQETPEPFRDQALPPGQTRFRLPQIEGSFWQGDGPPRTFMDVTDGTVNTLVAAIAPTDVGVIWTKPEPWELDAEELTASFFGDAETATVAFLDGSVRELPRSLDPEMLKAMLTHAGGEVVTMP